MNEQIKVLSEALKEEAEAVINYTEKIEESDNNTLNLVLEKIRLDEVEHMQSLVLEITKAITEPEKEEPKEGESE